MTKEETLNKALSEKRITGKGLVVNYPVEAIDAAMDKYAEQQAVLFAEWVEEYGLLLQSGLWACRHPQAMSAVATTAELYELYKQLPTK